MPREFRCWSRCRESGGEKLWKRRAQCALGSRFAGPTFPQLRRRRGLYLEPWKADISRATKSGHFHVLTTPFIRSRLPTPGSSATRKLSAPCGRDMVLVSARSGYTLYQNRCFGSLQKKKRLTELFHGLRPHPQPFGTRPCSCRPSDSETGEPIRPATQCRFCCIHGSVRPNAKELRGPMRGASSDVM